MKKNILYLLLSSLIMTILLLVSDLLFSLYNKEFYFRVSNKTILPALVYSLLVSFIAKKKWRNLSIILIFFASLLQYWYFQYFGEYFQAIAFIQFFNNLYEVYDSILPIVFSFLPPLGIVIFCSSIVIYISNKFDNKIFPFKFSSYLIVLGLIVNLVQTYIYIEGIGADGKLKHWRARALYPNKKELSTFNFHKSLNYFLVGIVPKKVFGNNLDFPILKAPDKINSEKNNIIFVLGESLRYDRLSLFGYNKTTTPMLDSLAKLGKIDYKYIYSGGTMTKTSSAIIFNRLKYPGMEQIIDKKNNLFKLAKENGYNTVFISAQQSGSMTLIENFMGLNYIDRYLNRGDFDKKCKGYTGKDEDIFPYLEKIDLSKKNFIVLQQRGSHSPYKCYTKKFDKFDNDYDNTICYTDYFLASIYKYLEKNTKLPTYFIFASDHGELLGEKGKNGHGWFEKEVYFVPMIATLFNTKDSIDFKQIDSHFDMSNFLVSFMGYDTKIESKKNKEIFVNGSDLDGLAGYLKFTFKNDSLLKKELIR